MGDNIMSLPRISSYGDYSSDNYGVNSLRVDFNGFTLFYSYKTIIAYRDNDDGFVMRKNDWSVVTGKHMNWLDDNKKSRLDGELFESKLQEMLNRHIK